MNMLFLPEDSALIDIPRGDRRFVHILKVLKKKIGDAVEAGRSDGTLGKAILIDIQDDFIRLRFVAEGFAPPLFPLRILMGFPRPIQAGRILKDLTSLGIASIWFALSELGEKSYAESSFFKLREFNSFCIEGAEQGGNPRLPEIRTFWSLDRALMALTNEDKTAVRNDTVPNGASKGLPTRVCLHPGSDLPKISSIDPLGEPITLALGSERGWTEAETQALMHHGFLLCQLGNRVLKTETAAVASAAIVLSRLGYI
jgi:RsmE family RNA methyltransferase